MTSRRSLRLDPPRWKRVLGLAVLIPLLLALAFFLRPRHLEDAQAQQVTVTRPGPSAKPPLATGADPWALLERAVQEGANSSAPIDDHAELLEMQEQDRAWCSAVSVSKRKTGVEQQEAQATEAATRATDEASTRLMARWQRLLTARGDALSQAASALLGGSQQRMRDLAMNTNDPRVLALLVGKTCPEDKACKATLIERWRQLDPENAMPWLWQLDGLPKAEGRSESHAASAARLAVLQGIANARHMDDGRASLQLLLHQVNASTGPGLYDTAALVTLVGIDWARVIPPLGKLSHGCREAAQTSALAVTCEGAAEVLWKHSDDRLMRSMAVRTAGYQEGLRQDPKWQLRAQQVEAVAQWSDDFKHHIDGLVDLVNCEPSQRHRQQTIKRLRQGDWEWSRQTMAEAQVDETALAQKYRAKGNKPLLRPADPPAPPPAEPAR